MLPPPLQERAQHVRGLASLFCLLHPSYDFYIRRLLVHPGRTLDSVASCHLLHTLARLGFNRNISRDIVFGSTLYGGIGMLHLFVEQGIAQLQLLVRHLRAKTTQGNLMIIGLSWWNLVAGYSYPLWMNPSANISYVEHSWFTSLKDFLSYVDGSIFIPPDEFIHWSPLRVHNIAIMERLSTLDGVSRADLNTANRCRLHSGVIFLSEIVTADGMTISRDAWTGSRPHYSPLLWPFQPSTGPQSA
jgi:hypothetical protein